MINISAIICTINRAAYLIKALTSLVEQTIDRELYEIVVVDNGSCDETAAIVSDFISKYTNIVYLYEPVTGLSKARNTGAEAARGQYLAFLDDDAVASPSWLANILKVFSQRGSMAGCVGGQIDLIWERPRPQWLENGLTSYLGELALSPSPKVLGPGEYVFGGNMALSRQALALAGGFSRHLGKVGSSLMANEEILLQDALRAISREIYYDPDILVCHHARAECLTRRWYVRRLYFQGVSEALTNRMISPGETGAGRLPTLISSVFKVIYGKFTTQRQRNAFRTILELSRVFGEYAGSSRRRLAGAP